MKKIILLLVSLTLVFAFVGCSAIAPIDFEEIVGTWSGEYTYKGNDFMATFVLSENGKYTKVVYKNGYLSDSEWGTWEIIDREVYLYENGNTGTGTIYKYKGGALVNNDHKFYKK